MSRFRSKPFEIDAVQITAADYNPALHGTEHNPWDSAPFTDLPEWLTDCIDVQKTVRPHTRGHTDYAEWDVTTANGVVSAGPGDWLIREPSGVGCYPCKPDVFAAKYEPLNEPPESASSFRV